jgi:hypothetical protein
MGDETHFDPGIYATFCYITFLSLFQNAELNLLIKYASVSAPGLQSENCNLQIISVK